MPSVSVLWPNGSSTPLRRRQSTDKQHFPSITPTLASLPREENAPPHHHTQHHPHSRSCRCRCRGGSNHHHSSLRQPSAHPCRSNSSPSPSMPILANHGAKRRPRHSRQSVRSTKLPQPTEKSVALAAPEHGEVSWVRVRHGQSTLCFRIRRADDLHKILVQLDVMALLMRICSPSSHCVCRGWLGHQLWP